MRKTVTRTYEVYSTGEYCGDFVDHKPCPQSYTIRFGISYLCGLYRTEIRHEIDLFPDQNWKTKRCKQCIADNGIDDGCNE